MWLLGNFELLVWFAFYFCRTGQLQISIQQMLDLIYSQVNSNDQPWFELPYANSAFSVYQGKLFIDFRLKTPLLNSEMLGLGFYGSFSKLSDHLASFKLWPVFLGGTSGKESTCQCRRHNRSWFDPWVGKIFWRKAWQPTPVSLLGESHGQRGLVGYIPQHRKESDMTEGSQHTQSWPIEEDWKMRERKIQVFLSLPISSNLTPKAIIFFQPQDILRTPRIDPQCLLQQTRTVEYQLLNRNLSTSSFFLSFFFYSQS